MSFVRIKKRKNSKGEDISYGYIVENRWLKRKVYGPRQKVKAYLGRVHEMKPTKDISFEQYYGSSPEQYYKGKDKSIIIQDLVTLELLKHGFQEIKDGVLEKEGLLVDIPRRSITKGRGTACIALNQGLLSSHSIKQLHRFQSSGEEDAYMLAKLLVESGLNSEKEQFIELFKKINPS